MKQELRDSKGFNPQCRNPQGHPFSPNRARTFLALSLYQQVLLHVTAEGFYLGGDFFEFSRKFPVRKANIL